MSQWVSAFAEKALNIEKAIGDLSGMCGFAFLMALTRMLHGMFGKKMKLLYIIIIGFALSTICYIVAVFSPNHIVSLIACAISGIGVALLWPGTLSLAAKRFPLAGSWMFAILAAAGDIGGSIGPWLVGKIADVAQEAETIKKIQKNFDLTLEQFGLKCGILIGTLFPLFGFIISLLLLCNRTKIAQVNSLSEVTSDISQHVDTIELFQNNKSRESDTFSLTDSF